MRYVMIDLGIKERLEMGLEMEFIVVASLFKVEVF